MRPALHAPRIGRDGVLHMRLRRDGERTVLAGAYSEVPLHVQRVLRRGGPLAYVYMASVSGGVLQGDRYHIGIEMERGAMAHITTQGATRIYGMESGSASQEISARLADGAYLELVPDQIIPYGGSRFVQEASLEVHSGATAVYSEVVAPGRMGMGESFRYESCNLKMTARDERGRYRIIDSSRMEPGRGMEKFGVMGGSHIVGTIYVMAPARHVPRLYEEAGAAISAAGMFGGATTTRDGAGLLVRVLGDRTDAVMGAVAGVVGAVRGHIIGEPLGEHRKS